MVEWISYSVKIIIIIPILVLRANFWILREAREFEERLEGKPDLLDVAEQVGVVSLV